MNLEFETLKGELISILRTEPQRNLIQLIEYFAVVKKKDSFLSNSFTFPYNLAIKSSLYNLFQYLSFNTVIIAPKNLLLLCCFIVYSLFPCPPFFQMTSVTFRSDFCPHLLSFVFWTYWPPPPPTPRLWEITQQFLTSPLRNLSTIPFNYILSLFVLLLVAPLI